MATHFYRSLVASSLMLVAMAAGAAAPVVVAPVQSTDIVTELEFAGSVSSPSSAQLSASTAGLAKSVLVDAGRVVERGELLLELDDELARLRVRGAVAALAQARHNLQDAQRRLEEIQALRADNSVAESTVLSQQSDVAAQLARVQKLSADAATARAVAARHLIRAPFAGVVSRRLIEPGEWVTPGTPVFQLVATGGLRVDLAIPEDHIARISNVTRAEVRPVSEPGKVLSSRVEVVVPVADPVSRTVLLRLSLPGDHGLVPGMSVRAKLQVPVNRDGLVVPRDAVLRYPDGRVVIWVLNGNGDEQRVAERVVRLGASFDNRVEVIGAINAGDFVVVEGNEALTDGQRVTVANRRR